MSAPTLPRLDAHRPPVPARAPHAKPDASPAFTAWLGQSDGDDPTETSATPFDGSGVLGRAGDVHAGDTRTTLLSQPQRAEDGDAIAFAPPAPASAHGAALTETAQLGAARMTACQHPVLPVAAHARHADEGIADGSTPQIQAPPQPSRAINASCANANAETDEIASALTTARLARKHWPAQAGASSVFVAVHALAQSCAVYARVGKTSTAERAHLRHAIRALLAEHGLAGDVISIDGVTSNANPGRDEQSW